MNNYHKAKLLHINRFQFDPNVFPSLLVLKATGRSVGIARFTQEIEVRMLNLSFRQRSMEFALVDIGLWDYVV